MDKWFHKQNKLVQVLLLLIPFVNWITEVLVRWSTFLRNGGALIVVISLVVTIFAAVIGWLDAIWTLSCNKLICE